MNKLYMMVGLSGSGKTTYAKKLSGEIGAEVFSSDEIRKELWGDESIQKDHSKVFEVLHKRIHEALKNGKDVIYDATNLSMKRRMAFLRSVPKDVGKIAIFMATLIDNCISMNSKRERVVPEEVIWKQAKSFKMPNLYEGFDVINVITDFNDELSDPVSEALMLSLQVQHDNPHHKYTIGEHCLNTCRYAEEHKMPEDVVFSAMFHDIGKNFCKEFDNEGIAHYVGHEGIGAYLVAVSLFNNLFIDKVTMQQAADIITLIQFHMDFFYRDEKGMEKLKKIIGEDLFDKLNMLHESDINSH